MLRKISIVFCFLILVSGEVHSSKDTLVIGKVTVSERQKTYNSMKPLLDFVIAQLGDAGIKKGEIFFASSNQEMIYALISGKVDWITDSAFSALIMSEKTGAEIALKRYKSGVADYHSVILVKNNREIESIEDLRVRTIAFEDIGSTSAYFLPFVEFLKHGITPVPEKNNKLNSGSNENIVYYHFSNSEFGMIKDLMAGKVDAVAYSNLDYEDLSSSIKSGLKVIHRSDAYPRGLELFSGKLDKNLRHRIVGALLNATNSRGGKNALSKYFNTDEFEIFSEDENISHARKIIKSDIIPTHLR